MQVEPVAKIIIKAGERLRDNFGSQKKESKMSRLTILLDLDGVLIRRYQKRPQMANQQALAEILDFLSGLNPYPRIICLTDRPASQLPYFVWVLKGDRYHGGELGSVIYDRDTYRVSIAPDYQDFAKEVRPQLVSRLQSRIRLDKTFEGPRQEIGGKLVTISMEPPLHKHHSFSAKTVRTVLGRFENEIYVSGGSAISVYPAGLDKLVGLGILQKLYEEQGNPLDLASAIWIADGDRDIPLVEHLAKHGGRSAAVGNASPAFKNAVKKHSGIIVKGEYEAGLLQILQALFK